MSSSIRALVGGRLNQYNPPIVNTTAPTVFHAVVLEVFNDPKSLTNDDIEDLRKFVSNPELIDTMPANSVVARITSNNQNSTDSSATIVYPFFQSHIMLPVQAGEQIMIIYDDYAFQGNSLGRWITRTPEGSTVEDINFTHGDRRFDPSNNPGQKNAAEQRAVKNNQTGPQKPSFPNGGGTPETYTIKPSSEEPNVNPFDSIYTTSISAKMHSFEPVPRWTKRPQELVLQGMNNSLIMLGQDRVGPAARPESNPPDKLKFAGAVDIVTGRGRVPLDPTENTAPSNKQTSPLTVQNTRNKLEVDKTPFNRNRQPNKKEGDPDFKTDAARIYVSMNTLGDTNFKLLDGTNGISYPTKVLKLDQQPTGPNENIGPSYIVSKADHVRMVARKSTEPEINGTVLILKEGTKDADLAYLYMDKTGKVQLEGKEIYIGQATDKDEPYIKWSKYKESVDKLHEEIDVLKSAISSIIQKLSIAGPTSVCAPFAPDPAWTGLVAQIQPILPEMNTNLSSKRQETNDSVTAAKSKKIFGS